ncbi:hypothetical protein Moror_5317 [Moniliophthora roreri MCA 2997]|nr:hypothetical protein Moror_5317 [Moniliophthora roreri MCA 2997]KAI3595088.1 hypothetical protein WG66_001096 [Moniliophthora roreri]
MRLPPPSSFSSLPALPGPGYHPPSNIQSQHQYHSHGPQSHYGATPPVGHSNYPPSTGPPTYLSSAPAYPQTDPAFPGSTTPQSTRYPSAPPGQYGYSYTNPGPHQSNLPLSAPVSHPPQQSYQLRDGSICNGNPCFCGYHRRS